MNGSGGHSIAAIKFKEQLYMYDPNLGVLKMNEEYDSTTGEVGANGSSFANFWHQYWNAYDIKMIQFVKII